jgi:hypothetical protein
VAGFSLTDIFSVEILRDVSTKIALVIVITGGHIILAGLIFTLREYNKR